MQTSIRVEHVTKQYGAQTVLNDISFSLAPGEMICLLGPSGCGKSTLLRMGLLKIDHIRALTRLPRIREELERKRGRPVCEADVQAIYAVFEKTLLNNLEAYSALKPDVPEALAALRARGIRIGSTSGYTRAMMDRITQSAARQGYRPECCVCADEVSQGRPHPFMIWKNMLPPIFLIVLGLYGINLEGWGRRRLLAPLRTLAKEPRTRLSLLNGLVIAAYTLTDGRTVRYADPLWIYFWISVIPAALLAPAMLRQGRIRREWKRDGLRAAAVSALTFAAYALVLLAMRRGSAACVSAVREVSIVFVTLYARFVLREKMPAVKLLSSAVIFLGILLLDLGPR